MAARWWIWVVLATVTAPGCTRSTAPKARLVGEVASLAGLAGILASTALVSQWGDAKRAVAGFAIGMGLGMTIYAVGELTDPANDETEAERNRRWARMLTDQARDAARDHRCDDVRGLELRVKGYDAEQHDRVLMRDPAVAQCFVTGPAAIASPPAAPGSR